MDTDQFFDYSRANDARPMTYSTSRTPGHFPFTSDGLPLVDHQTGAPSSAQISSRGSNSLGYNQRAPSSTTSYIGLESAYSKLPPSNAVTPRNQSNEDGRAHVPFHESVAVPANIEPPSIRSGASPFPSPRCCKCRTRASVVFCTSYGLHDESTPVWGPLPHDPNIRDSLGLHPEWTLWVFYCEGRCGYFQMYRFHLVSCDLFEKNLSTDEQRTKINNLLWVIEGIFHKFIDSATGIFRNGRNRSSPPAQEPHVRTLAPQAIHRPAMHASSELGQQANAKQEVFPGQGTNYRLDHEDIPLNSPCGVNPRSTAPKSALRDMPYNLINPYPSQRSSALTPAIQGNTASQEQEDDIEQPRVADTTRRGKKRDRKTRKMDHESYRAARSAGTCQYSRDRHTRCLCHEGKQTCEQRAPQGTRGSFQADSIISQFFNLEEASSTQQTTLTQNQNPKQVPGPTPG